MSEEEQIGSAVEAARFANGLRVLVLPDLSTRLVTNLREATVTRTASTSALWRLL
jgi:hypothetical protein